MEAGPFPDRNPEYSGWSWHVEILAESWYSGTATGWGRVVKREEVKQWLVRRGEEEVNSWRVFGDHISIRGSKLATVAGITHAGVAGGLLGQC